MEQFVTDLIGNYAFPIIVCFILFWSNDKEGKSHKEEVKGLTEVIQQNTIAINKLVDHMEREGRNNERN